MTGAKNLEFVNNHTLDITGEEGEKGYAGATTLNTAIQKASGDKKAKFTMAIMHSTVATNLENLQLLAYLKYTDANGVQREMDRNPAKNGGQDTLYARQRKVFAPYGISYTKKSQAKLSPTDEELANGANWELVNDGASTAANKKYIDHKQIYIARIISKG